MIWPLFPGSCATRTSDASSTVAVTTAGSATIRITWSAGLGNAVFTNQCTYTVAALATTSAAAAVGATSTAAAAATTTAAASIAATPKPSAARRQGATASAGAALLAAALASLLPLVRAGHPRAAGRH
jgi:hypothetical protein